MSGRFEASDPLRGGSWRYVIVNGFDRSGTSMIARLLARHPDVELFFQPFSGTAVHRTQWEIWDESVEAPEVEAFLRGLSAGRLDRNFLSSDWFVNHSSVFEPRPGRLHVIKSTKLHFKIRWFRAHWPQTPIFGIYRDPRAVLCSLVRNDFHRTWYGERAFEAAERAIVSDPGLRKAYSRFLGPGRSDVERMALAVAARTHVMARDLPRDAWIRYEEVLRDPNGTLNRFLARFGCPEHDFSRHVAEDFNVVGKPFERADLWRDFFDSQTLERIEPILFAWPGPDPA